jgi:hypothetical protein
VLFFKIWSKFKRAYEANSSFQERLVIESKTGGNNPSNESCFKFKNSYPIFSNGRKNEFESYYNFTENMLNNTCHVDNEKIVLKTI